MKKSQISQSNFSVPMHHRRQGHFHHFAPWTAGTVIVGFLFHCCCTKPIQLRVASCGRSPHEVTGRTRVLATFFDLFLIMEHSFRPEEFPFKSVRATPIPDGGGQHQKHRVRVKFFKMQHFDGLFNCRMVFSIRGSSIRFLFLLVAFSTGTI